MTTAVAYAYTSTAEERPTLLDQFTACRNYAAAHNYEIVGEFNDIDEADHRATGAGQAAIRCCLLTRLCTACCGKAASRLVKHAQDVAGSIRVGRYIRRFS